MQRRFCLGAGSLDLAGGGRMSARNPERDALFTAMWKAGRVRKDIADAMDFQSLESVNHHAKRLGLAKRHELKSARVVEATTERKCMTCQHVFDSVGPHNRMCGRCRLEPSAVAYAHPGIRVHG